MFFLSLKIKKILSQKTKQKKHDLKFTKNHYFEKLSAQLKTRTHTQELKIIKPTKTNPIQSTFFITYYPFNV